jgi:Phage tail lysozyme
VNPATTSHRKHRQSRTSGRHAAPSKSRRRTAVVSIAVPAVALAVTFAAVRIHDQPDPVARGLASYQVRSLVAGSGTADARAVALLPLASPSAASKTGKPAAAASPSPAPSATPSPAPPPPACAGNGAGGTGMLPLNYVTIVDFLVAHGYTRMAAAGIAGNIYQESQGDPESVGTGGGGLIGWTPLPAGFVTGNAAADLQTQLAALLSYNQEWAQYLPVLNAATSPAGAADVYMNYFERPGIPAASNREGAAIAVAQACGIS